MSFNAILSKIPVGSITKGGQTITVSVATRTSTFVRPEQVAVQQGPSFTKAVEANSELIPAATVDICQRETNHTSDSDPRDHYTGVCFDE